MCKAFSCIVMENGKTFWKEGLDSHEDIIKLYKIHDNQQRPFQNFARVEILPKDGNYLNPDQPWMYTIDENVVPLFINDFHRECCFQALEQWKEKVYSKINLAEVKNPFHPFSIIAQEINKSHIDLLKNWNSVRNSVWDSVGNSVRDSVGDSVWDSVRDSVRIYIGSLFLIKKWQHIDYNNPLFMEGTYPFQPAVDLWKQGLIPAKINNEKWILIGKDQNNKIKILWEGICSA